LTETEARDDTGYRDIAAKLPLDDHRVPLAGRTWSIMAVRDHDALLEDTSAFQHTPYGLLLWESAIALAGLLAQREGKSLHGKRVLELGCGVGLPGIVASSFGAIVSQTDHEPVALTVARENARRNDCRGVAQFKADWSQWTHDFRYDMIIGSDIGYGTDMHDHLVEIFNRNLIPGGKVLIADPGRDQNLVLLGCLERTGWTMQRESETLPDASGRTGVAPITVNLFTCQRTG
jgi:methyltransferase-like protein 23